MPDFYQTPRYQLPDDWSPEGTICVRVTIPNDIQYLGQLIGLLDSLKWSKNFAPDETKTGAATVSRTWQSALESVPIITEGCDMPEFRIDPETCLLEVNCSTDPENPDWQPVPTAAYDPRTDGTYPTPFPDPEPTDQCLAAATVAEYVWFAGNAFANQLDDAIGAPFIVLVMSVITGLFTLLVDLVIDATTTLFTQIDPDTILADWALIDKQDFIDLINCHLNPDGTFIISEWGDFLDELLALGVSNQAWYLVHYICGLMGVGGVSIAGAMGGVTTAECAPCGELWSHTFDFTIDEQGWSADSVGETPIAVYTAGVGWRGVILGGDRRFAFSIAGFEVDTASLQASFDVETGGDWPNACVRRQQAGTAEFIEGCGAFTAGDGQELEDIENQLDTNRLQFNGNFGGGGWIYVTSITVTGYGINPFI